MRFKIIAMSIILFLICSCAIQAEGRHFIDFDGDGFSDNIIDFDNNSIPDEFQSKVKELKSHTRTFTFSPTALFSDKSKDVKLTVSQKFSLHQFKARQLAKCRSNFDSDFNSGLSAGASSGGGCVGGVCF